MSHKLRLQNVTVSLAVGVSYRPGGPGLTNGIDPRSNPVNPSISILALVRRQAIVYVFRHDHGHWAHAG